MSETAFTPEAIAELDGPLDPRRVVAFQSGPQKGVPYLEGHDVIRRANEIFGYGNWGFELVGQPTMVESGEQGNNKTPYQVWMAVGRLSIAGGQSVTEIGTNVRQGGGSASLEMAIKGAVTDAIKRCLTHLGDQFGLVLRDKSVGAADLRAEYQAASGKPPAQQQRRDVDPDTGEIPASDPPAHQPAPQAGGTRDGDMWKVFQACFISEHADKAAAVAMLGGFSAGHLSAWMREHNTDDPVEVVMQIRERQLAGAR